MLPSLSLGIGVEIPRDDISTTNWIEVPTLGVNFHLMGSDTIDSHYLNQIFKNVAYINEEFEGQVRFEVSNIWKNNETAFLPDLHIDALTIGEAKIKALVEPIEQKGAINVFVFDTYVPEGSYNALMGFTPILSDQHQMYEAASPQFDRIFMAYGGLDKKTTLVHELGHFLGLDHPWEMNTFNRNLMGLTNSNPESNHMTYHHQVNKFTPEQLERMRDFAISYRSYLIQDIQLVASN